jgi:hypothetical protein
MNDYKTQEPYFRIYKFLTLVLIASFSLPGCAVVDVYNMQGMEGTIIDKETKQSLEGVMIIEVWEAGGGFEGHTVAYLPLQEAVSDQNGLYAIPARGTHRVKEGFLKASTPRLIFFKPGYTFFSKRNRYHPDRRFEFNRRSDWHQKTIEMEKFEGTLEEQARELERFSSVLGDFTGRGGDCIWMGIPKTLWEVYQEYKRLLLKGVLARVAIGALHNRNELSLCPSSEVFKKVFGNESQ